MINPRTLVTLLVGALWLVLLGGCYPSSEIHEVGEFDHDQIEAIADQPPKPKISWESASDCRGKLRLLQQGLHRGDIETLEGSPFLLISDQRFAELDRWLGGPRQVSLARDDDAQDSRCVIRLGETHAHKAEHRVLSQEQVRSSYQSGTYREKNPAYDAAQARLRQAERANKPKKSSLISVGDPLIDLIGTLVGGAITGVGQLGQGDPVEEAIEALVATPRSIEHPKYRSYSFERTKIRASREAVIPVIMTDRHLQKSWRTSMKRRELKELIVLDGLDRQDRDYAEHRKNSMTDQQFRQWQAEPPAVPFQDMIVSLLGAESTSSVDRVASLGGFNDRPPTSDHGYGFDAAAAPPALMTKPVIDADRGGRMPRPAAPEIFQYKSRHMLPNPSDRNHGNNWASRADEPARGMHISRDEALDRSKRPIADLVTIEGGDDRGQGIYVTSDFVLTGSDLVEGYGLVDVKFKDGDSVLGMVVRVDRSRGLALIQVARPGIPVVIDAYDAYQPRLPYQYRSNAADQGNEDHRLGDGLSDDSRAENIGQESGPILKRHRLIGFRSQRGPDISISDIRAFLDEETGVFLSRR